MHKIDDNKDNRFLMKRAYEKYFSRLDSLYFETFGTKPTVPYSETCNKKLYIGMPDEDGEIQWAPQEQRNVFEWDNVEREIGFALCQELKDYYNTYYFLSLVGTYEECELHFYKIDGAESLDVIALRNYEDAQCVFPNTECFLIGNASISDDDSYFIYYDNAAERLFCYESDTKKMFRMSQSMTNTIGSMEASL